MKDVYSVAGISKQAIQKYQKRKDAVLDLSMKVIHHCTQTRKSHPRMSCRRIYKKVADELPIGRDLFEQIGFNNGFKLKIKKNQMKTTWSSKLPAFENLLEGKTITDINQAWQCDFFYLKVEGIDHYGVTIIDIYSRQLLALQVSRSLSANQLIKAFKEALKVRKGEGITRCIFHSDRGRQFFAEDFKALLKNSFTQSMCKLPQENAYVERIQGTLKYEYLFETELTIKDLSSQIKFIQYLYNYERPHTQLGNLSPIQFEQQLNQTKKTDMPQLTVYEWAHPLLTKIPVTNKEKRSKKETTTNSN